MNHEESLPEDYADLYDGILKAVQTKSPAFRNKAARNDDKSGKLDQFYDSYFFYHWVGSIPGDSATQKRFKEDLTKIYISEAAWKNSPRNGIANLDATKSAFDLSARLNFRTVEHHLAGYLKYAESEGADLFALRDLKLKGKATALLAWIFLGPVAKPPEGRSGGSKPTSTAASSTPPFLPEQYLHLLTGQRGYFRGESVANAIRLIGAGGEAFTTRDIVVSTTQDRFIKPPQMLPIWGDVLDHVKESAMERGFPFHNSLHTRLVDYSIHIVPHTERKQLHLILGPIYWEEYSVPRWLTDRMNAAELNNYIHLDQVAATGKISDSKLHNIVGTVTTLLTADGYLLYSRRSERVSVAEDSFTSCIAENISAEKDSSLGAKENALLPSPFRAAARGALEELSKGVSVHLLSDEECNLICLGLSFDLGSYHPDIILFGVLPIAFAEVQKLCREDPGEDFFEGEVRGIHLSRIQKGEYGDVSLTDWTGSGKASVLRAVEFLGHWAKVAHCELADIAPRLKITASDYGI